MTATAGHWTVSLLRLSVSVFLSVRQRGNEGDVVGEEENKGRINDSGQVRVLG